MGDGATPVSGGGNVMESMPGCCDVITDEQVRAANLATTQPTSSVSAVLMIVVHQ